MENISWSDFERVDLRIGTIISATTFPKAKKPAYQLQIDFGEELGVLNSSAQITFHYSIEDLIGIQIVAVVNFPPKQIANFFSQCLVTGFPDENNNIILTTIDKNVPNGTRLM